eukprot:GFUD01009705.1.p1 GENE.GFUD01009705.1~~GFUD01009705.1.p1  ORF type:complete len:284 (+),score=89.42 GFUD01009705.1:87-938(+)
MFAVKNWSQVLDPAFGIPTDVAFNIMEEDDNEDNRQEYIPAHKYFLAVVSPVFKTMFFGLAKETREVVPIKGLNKEAFKLMIDYIYQKEICWEERSITLLLEVVNMAEMYDLGGLMEEVKKPLAKFPLTPETVVPVASTVQEFSQFEDISNQLLDHCATFLATQVLTTKTATRQFASTYIDSPYYATAFKLLELAKDVPPAKCHNCMQVECEDRLPVSLESMRRGCRVAFRLGTCMVEEVGWLVEECYEHSGHKWLVRLEMEEGEEEELVKVKLINLFFACKL